MKGDGLPCTFKLVYCPHCYDPALLYMPDDRERMDRSCDLCHRPYTIERRPSGELVVLRGMEYRPIELKQWAKLFVRERGIEDARTLCDELQNAMDDYAEELRNKYHYGKGSTDQ